MGEGVEMQTASQITKPIVAEFARTNVGSQLRVGQLPFRAVRRSGAAKLY